MRIEKSIVILVVSTAFSGLLLSEGSSSGNPPGYGGYNYGQQQQQQQQTGWQGQQSEYYQQPNPAQPPESERLPPLPAGWTEHFDPDSGMPYYHNTADGTTTWDRPVAEMGSEEVPAAQDKEEEEMPKPMNATSTPATESRDESQMYEEATGETSEQSEVRDVGGTQLPEEQGAYTEQTSQDQNQRPVSDENALTGFKRSEENIRREEAWRESQGWAPEGDKEVSDERQQQQQQQQLPQGWGMPSGSARDEDQFQRSPHEASKGPDQRPGPNVQPGADQTRQGSDYSQDVREKQRPADQEQQPGGWGFGRTEQQRPESPTESGTPRADSAAKDREPNVMAPWESQPQTTRLPIQSERPSQPFGRQQQGPDQIQRPPRQIEEDRRPRMPGQHTPEQRAGEQHSLDQQYQSEQGQREPETQRPTQQSPYAQYGQGQQRPPQQQTPYTQQRQDQQRPPPQQQRHPYAQHGQQPSQQQRPPMQNPYGQYSQYSQYAQHGTPQGYGQHSNQLTSQESPTAGAVREALGRSWQGILGFGNRTKEAVENARDTVVSGAKEASQTITSSSTTWWDRTKNTFGSVFEQGGDDQQGQYSLSGRYGAPPAPGARPPPGYTQQGYPPQQAGQQRFPPHQPGQQGYPPQQQGGQGYPPQQPGQQGYPPQQQGGPPQGRYPPGYGPPQPRTDPSYPHEQQQGSRQDQPPIQSQWGQSPQQYPPQAYPPNQHARYPGQQMPPPQPGQPGQHPPQQQRPHRPQQQSKEKRDDKTDPWQHPGLGPDGY